MNCPNPLEQNKAIVTRFLDDTHCGRIEAVDQLVAEDIVTHGFPGANPDSHDTYKQFFRMLNGAFPDMALTVYTLVAEDDRVAVHFGIEATHLGEFAGIPATGRTVSFSGMVIYRLKQGRIAETWLQPDNLTLIRQLGGRWPELP